MITSLFGSKNIATPVSLHSAAPSLTSIAALHRLVKLVAALLRGYASKVDTHMSGNSVYWVHVSLIKSSSFAVEIFWFKSKREIKVERRKKGMYCKK
ncbi:hypothetical protein QQP08_018187 [Theobroma cacao]|nr:hypothetical protein QQP08_018187 [Theobroma cacao]